MRSRLAGLPLSGAAVLLLSASVLAAGAASDAIARPGRACAPPRLAPPVETLSGEREEVVAVDASGSTMASALRADYRQVVEGVLQRARAERAVFVLETFTASSSSAAVRFAGSFDPDTGDDVFDLGADNRVACQAEAAIQMALPPARTRPQTTGSDIAGGLAAAVTLAQPAVKAHEPVTVTLVTDGWIAPSTSGANRHLFDLRAAIARGEAPAAIIRAHADQLLVTDAHGIDLVVRGLDHGTDQAFDNTVQAARLTAFYRTYCHRLGARSCDVTAGF